MVVQIPYVVKRGRSWQYRRRPPPDVRETIGRVNWYRTWRPGTAKETVIFEAAKLARKHDAEIARARGDTEAAEIAKTEDTARWIGSDAEDVSALIQLAHGGEVDPDPATQRLIEALLHGGKVPRKTLTVSQALERDREIHSADIDPRPGRYAVRSFIETIGDSDILAISRDDVSTWIAAQRDKGHSPATIKRRFGALKALVNRAMLDLGSERRSPFEGHKLGGKGGSADRLPLSKPMISKLLHYLDHSKVNFETAAILRLMLFTGCGPAEIGGLAVSDMSLDGKIPFLHVRENGVRSLKTPSRQRRVPLVGMALDVAQEVVKRAGNRQQLFTSYSASRGADSLSATLNACIRRSKIPKSPRLTSYSLRHTMSEALRLSGASYSIQRRLLGHATKDISDAYGSPAAMLAEAKAALEAAIPLLGEVDDSIYSAAERL